MTDDTDFSNKELPIVTVFGAGIAGLTAAHELVERGFTVQVVEPTPHPTREYECAVGGLAANQFSRVRSPLEALHPWLMIHNNKNWGRALAFRDWNKTIEPSAARFPINQKLRFDRQRHRPETVDGGVSGDADDSMRSHLERRHRGKTAPPEWRRYWDAHGVSNETKLDEVFHTIQRASRHYMRLYFAKLAGELDKNPNFDPKEHWKDFSPVYEPTEKADGKEERTATADENARQFVARETYFVRIIAYTDADSTEEENRKLARHWATQVKQALLEENDKLARKGKAAAKHAADKKHGDKTPAVRGAAAAKSKPDRDEADYATAFIEQPIWELERRLEIVVRGSAGAVPGDDARARSLANRVEFEVVEQLIPGEHGFRFFPGFYRHIFDTMKRTPLLNDRGLASETAFNQLIQTPNPQLSLKGGLHDFDSRNITTLAQARRSMDLMTKQLKFKSTDLLGLSIKTFRFLTSGWKRRENETENITMIDYIGGANPRRLYTQACLDFIDKEPRALAAMSAGESDARSQYSILLQLGSKSLPDPATLNGPTSLAWLDPWKAYLKRQGVKFFVGRLVGMAPLDKTQWKGETATRLVPVTQGPDPKKDKHGNDIPSDPLPENPDDIYRKPGHDPNPGFQHRFVLATQFQRASDIAWKARDLVLSLGGHFEGPFAQLVEFDIAAERRLPGDAQARPPVRDPITGRETPKWPTRTISGAQFFFPQSYRFGLGNVYFCDTPYALTSISQYAYWRQRSGPVGQLLGQISIDIADWHAPYPKANPAAKHGSGHPAFYSSSQEVAQFTWEQVLTGLKPAYASVIQAPRYYHLDQHMVFRETERSTEPPGWIFTGGVRANAVLHVPENENADASLALVAGRAYWTELRVGQAGEPIRTQTYIYREDALTSLRDALFKDLLDKAGDQLLLEKVNANDIVVSPVANLTSATLRVLKAPPLTGAANKPFRLVVEGYDITVPAGDPAAVIERLVAQLVKLASDVVKIDRPAPDYLTLTPVKGETLKVGVINADRRIELVGAPSLIVKTLNLQVIEPQEGFALIRNNYQYIIDIPGQWKYRPGLRRGEGAIPEDFVKLSHEFGVKRPEIYYAHPDTCPLLEKWVGAGAHMATYTRMTTMEAANESGRHAAAALIYKLHSDAIRDRELHYQALAGDFPMIYPVEDNEGEDFEIFKKLDNILYDMGQPHLFEVIGLSQLVDSIQANDFNQAQIQMKLAPLLAGLPAMPGLHFAAPEFGAKLGELIRRIVSTLGSDK